MIIFTLFLIDSLINLTILIPLKYVEIISQIKAIFVSFLLESI